MKFPFSPRLLMLFLGLSTFIACKKDDAPQPDPIKDTPEQVLFKKIQGKWSAELEAFGRVKGKNIPVSMKNQDRGSILSSIEFFEDSTYVLGTYYSYVTGTGRFTVIDSATVQIGELITFRNISFTGDQISFTVELDDETLPVVATKSPALQIPDSKKAILNNWTLVVDENTGDYFKYWLEDIGADRVKRLFTVNGTILTQFYDGDEVLYSFSRSWKWHPEIADAIVEYYHVDDIDYNQYYAISTLNSNEFSVTEYYNESGADEPYKLGQYNYFINPPAENREK